MLRYIDLHDQIYDKPRFAWYSTVTDDFLSVNGQTTWECWEEFEAEYLEYLKDSPHIKYDLERFRHLFREPTLLPPIKS